MDFKLKIDCREPPEIKQHFKNAVNTTFENLIVGDFLFQDSNGEPKLIIERKSIADLQSSLKDGRFREQRTRLLETGIKIIYIIEGQISDDKCVLGALENLALYHNICVLPTASIQQTITTLESLLKKVGQDYTPVESKTCKPRYKKNVNKSSLHLMLETINGISSTIARTVAKEYTSVYDFCTRVQHHDDDGGTPLHELKLSDKRKLGVKTADKIRTAFFSSLYP